MAPQSFAYLGIFVINAADLTTMSAPAKPYKNHSERRWRRTLHLQTDLLRLFCGSGGLPDPNSFQNLDSSQAGVVKTGLERADLVK